MPELPLSLFAILFPLLFGALWLTVVALTALSAGWFRLTAKFPDQRAEPLLRLACQSGTMGAGVHMRGVLTLSACRPGLRVGMMRLLGPFCRDFLVPWESIAVIRRKGLLGPVVELQFGNPAVGRLFISGGTVDRLAAAAAGRWPESGPVSPETGRDRLRWLLPAWALATACAAAIFIIVAGVMAPGPAQLPVSIAILLPAVFFGLIGAIRFFRR